MKVFKTFKDFLRATPLVEQTKLDPKSYYYESILCSPRSGVWLAILYDSDTNTMDIIAEFYSFKEALRWAEAYWMCDYGWYTNNPDEYDDYEVVK
jgi:hypothetical protein